MGEVLFETNIPREEGYLYYTGTNSKGFITICRAKMSRGGKKKKK